MTTVGRLVLLVLCVACSIGTNAQGQDDPVYDEDIHVLSFTESPYPRIAITTSLQGLVVVKATLDSDGNVVAATALSGPKLLAATTAQNTKQWRFKPNARKQAIVVYEYRIEPGRCLDDTRSMFLLRHPNFVSIVACQGSIPG